MHAIQVKKQWKHIQAATKALNVPYQVGGGIRSEQDVSDWLKAGANQVVIGSMAVEKREQVKAWIEQFGAEHFVIALDVNKTATGWAPATHGWLSESEFGLLELVDFLCRLGCYRLFYARTSVKTAL